MGIWRLDRGLDGLLQIFAVYGVDRIPLADSRNAFVHVCPLCALVAFCLLVIIFSAMGARDPRYVGALQHMKEGLLSMVRNQDAQGDSR